MLCIQSSNALAGNKPHSDFKQSERRELLFFCFLLNSVSIKEEEESMKYLRKKKCCSEIYIALNMPAELPVRCKEQHAANISSQASFHCESLLNS